MSNRNLVNILNEELVSENIFDVPFEIGEVVIDQFLDDGILKDIPKFGIVYKTLKGIISIPDKLLMIKVLYFLDGIKNGNIPMEKRVKFIENINKSETKNKNVGFDLINILDKSDNLQKTTIIAKAFEFCLLNKITYDDFLRITHGINLAFISDLVNLINDALDKDELNRVKENLFITGFIRIKNGETWNDVGKTYYELNELAQALINILEDLVK